MASDVRYILELSNEAQERERRERDNKEKKPDGMNRELFNLLGGGIPPLMPVYKPTVSKERGQIEKWKWVEFENTARKDNLKLWHWEKESNLHESYPFAKLNKKADIIELTPQDYDKNIEALDPSWSKKETFHLWDLCVLFDLRFIVVTDRHNMTYNRTVEEVKERYYSVAKYLLEKKAEFNHPIVKKPYNFEYEVRRKNNLEKLFLRTIEQENQEKKLLDEVKVLEQKIKKEEKEQRNLEKLLRVHNNESKHEIGQNKKNKNRSLTVNTAYRGIIHDVNSPGSPRSPSIGGRGGRRDRGSGVYLRSQRLNAPLPISEKLQKKLDIVMKELGILKDVNSMPNLLPTETVITLYDQLRKETLKMFSLKRHLKKKEEKKKMLEMKLQEVSSNDPSISGVMYQNPQVSIKEEEEESTYQPSIGSSQPINQRKGNLSSLLMNSPAASSFVPPKKSAAKNRKTGKRKNNTDANSLATEVTTTTSKRKKKN